jgi:hypothetical protein
MLNTTFMIIDSQYRTQAITPVAYLEMLESYANEGRSSGPNQSEAYVHYSKLNAQRSRRLMKTAQLTIQITQLLDKIKSPQNWFVLTESWCGDAANSLPFFFKMAEYNPLISIHVLLRDEHPALMDQFLTNGGRSIPKVIATDDQLRYLADWGPRPATAQKIYLDWKNSEDKVPYDQVQITLQKWYHEDKGETLQKEWKALLARAVTSFVH